MDGMSKKRFSAKQGINRLREAEVLQAKGQNIGEACWQMGITEQSYCRRRKAYGGLRVDQAKRLKQLEQENSRLKKVVADMTVDNAILKEAARETSRLYRVRRTERSRVA
jgi:cell division protein FtsB